MVATQYAQGGLLDYLVRTLGADLSARAAVYTTSYAPHYH
jgi:hypothetical protein